MRYQVMITTGVTHPQTCMHWYFVTLLDHQMPYIYISILHNILPTDLILYFTYARKVLYV